MRSCMWRQTMRLGQTYANVLLQRADKVLLTFDMSSFLLVVISVVSGVFIKWRRRSAGWHLFKTPFDTTSLIHNEVSSSLCLPLQIFSCYEENIHTFFYWLLMFIVSQSLIFEWVDNNNAKRFTLYHNPTIWHPCRLRCLSYKIKLDISPLNGS